IRHQTTTPDKLGFARELRKNLTPEERALWQELRTNKIGAHFRRQHIIGDYIADFFCHSAKLVVEIDGMEHRERVGHDKVRDAFLARLGIRTLRISSKEVRDNLDAVLNSIAAAINLTPDPFPAREGGPGRKPPSTLSP
ncbi:MAG TPA: DUF559 domain-containing protein, partial [Candidatus Binataceae bacterium]|nr:DUF559 domain-containing protein [Candidatus Binataceae bacterium]